MTYHFEHDVVSIYLKVRRAIMESSDAVSNVIDDMVSVIDNPESSRDDIEMAMGTICEALFH